MSEKLVRAVLRDRECAAVKRCHTTPHFGEYTVGIHSLNMIAMSYRLYPKPPSSRLIQCILTHDFGERWVGDIPAPAKWASDTLGTVVSSIEKYVLKKSDWANIDQLLDEEETAWVKALDALELWLWAHEQLAMGNQYAHQIIKTLQGFLKRPDINIPVPIRQFVSEYEWKHTSDLIEEIE